MKDWSNTMLTGFVAGILTPLIAFRSYVFFFRKGESLTEVVESFMLRDVHTHVISLSVIPNLLVFFLFLWSSRERSSNGVIGATILYALTVAILILI